MCDELSRCDQRRCVVILVLLDATQKRLAGRITTLQDYNLIICVLSLLTTTTTGTSRPVGAVRASQAFNYLPMVAMEQGSDDSAS